MQNALQPNYDICIIRYGKDCQNRNDRNKIEGNGKQDFFDFSHLLEGKVDDVEPIESPLEIDLTGIETRYSQDVSDPMSVVDLEESDICMLPVCDEAEILLAPEVSVGDFLFEA